MNFIQNLIKHLFPNIIITHRITDLNNKLLEQNDKKHIHISIEKENKSRQYCSLTIEQLLILYQHCPVLQRSLYESIPPTKPVKIYIDFEYYIDNNLDIENHHTASICSLKIVYYLLNVSNEFNTNNINETYIQNILKQFLVLEASTSTKISYHFIHAQPSVLFENISTLGAFIKVVVHFLLTSIIRHKCIRFNITFPTEESSTSKIIQILEPHIDTLRKHCTSCYLSIPYISVADIAHLLIRNKTNEWSLAIDTHVYSKNQQFRLYNSVKHGENNPLIPPTTFPFHHQLNFLSTDLLAKSLITLNEDDQIPIVSFKNNKFQINSPFTSNSDSINPLLKNFSHIELINEHISKSDFPNIHTNINPIQNFSHSTQIYKINNIDLHDQHIKIYTTFVENIIKSDPSHQGYIHSCNPGTQNKSLLFFNIAGDYRYCPKKKGHHQSNSVAIMINTKNYTYCIRCKDSDCDNTILIWKKIQ